MKAPFESLIDSSGDWETRLAIIVETMREMSRQTDPQDMVRSYANRMRKLLPTDGMVSISRRGLEPPYYRITRSSKWDDNINPWKDKDRLPLLKGGLLGELIYGDSPRIMDDFQIGDDEPAAEHLAGQKSLIAIPHYDQGVALNMIVFLKKTPRGFDREQFPEWVWMSNLFGRATQNLVLSEQVREAYEAVDHELRIVADIQRALLPTTLPEIPTLRLAAHYQTARRAGGDYYDFFPLPDGKWGILLADVSGHGTPAAVMMAVTHSIAHSFPGPPTPPTEMLQFINHHLSIRYTGEFGTFVTAFYGIYDPETRGLAFANAGHNPPRLKRCSGGSIQSLDGSRRLPLGIADGEKYEENFFQLQTGDQLIFYTDGITEAQNGAGQMFGLDRLDETLGDCRDEVKEIIDSVLLRLEKFTNGQLPADDRTLLVAKVL